MKREEEFKPLNPSVSRGNVSALTHANKMEKLRALMRTTAGEL